MRKRVVRTGRSPALAVLAERRLVEDQHLVDRQAQVLRPEADLVEDRGRDDLGIRVLKDHGDVSRQTRNRHGTGINSPNRNGSVHMRPDDVRCQAVEGERERRLPAPD
jgi:hypothetical protein